MTKKKYRASKFNMIITTANILMLFINLFAFNNDTPDELPVAQTSTETYSEYSTYNQNEVLTEEITIVSEVPVKEPSYFIEANNDGFLTEDSIRSISEYVGIKTNINPILLQAIAWGESRYKTNVTSSDGAVGICQIMPKIHSDRLIKLGITDLTDPYQNMVASADYIKDIENSKYGADSNFVIMAYKMGISEATKRYEQGLSSKYVTYINKKIIELEDYYNE